MGTTRIGGRKKGLAGVSQPAYKDAMADLDVRFFQWIAKPFRGRWWRSKKAWKVLGCMLFGTVIAALIGYDEFESETAIVICAVLGAVIGLAIGLQKS